MRVRNSDCERGDKNNGEARVRRYGPTRELDFTKNEKQGRSVYLTESKTDKQPQRGGAPPAQGEREGKVVIHG